MMSHGLLNSMDEQDMCFYSKIFLDEIFEYLVHCAQNKGELGEHLYKCPKCDITSKHGHFITHHKKVHGGFPPGYENIKKVMCDKCPEEFLTNNALRQHRMKQFCHSSTAEKIICDQCGPSESFNHPSYLIIHYRETHGSFPPIYESR